MGAGKGKNRRIQTKDPSSAKNASIKKREARIKKYADRAWGTSEGLVIQPNGFFAKRLAEHQVDQEDQEDRED